MEIKITQNSVGQFNLLGNEETLSFFMIIAGEDGRAITEGGNKAELHYSGDPGEQSDFEYYAYDIDWIFDKCYGYSKRVWGSTDYSGNAELFARLFCENFEELSKAHEAKKRTGLERELADIQKKLDNYLGLSDSREEIALSLEKEAQKYDKWAESSEKEAEQYVIGSEKAEKEREKITNYREKAAKLRSILKDHQ